MTDKKLFIDLLNKAKSSYEERIDNLMFEDAASAIMVDPGYRCHFEAFFDADENIIAIGQLDEM